MLLLLVMVSPYKGITVLLRETRSINQCLQTPAASTHICLHLLSISNADADADIHSNVDADADSNVDADADIHSNVDADADSNVDTDADGAFWAG